MSTTATVPVNKEYLEELQDFRTKARELGKALRPRATDIKPVGMAVGVGALIMFLGTSDDVKNSKMIKENWWLLPLAILALGYYLYKKNSPHWTPILTMGGALMIKAYNERPKKDDKPALAAPAKSDTGSPFDVAGGDDSYAWIQTASGQWVRVQLGAMMRQFGPALSTLPPGGAIPQAGAAQPLDAASRLAAAAFSGAA